MSLLGLYMYFELITFQIFSRNLLHLGQVLPDASIGVDCAGR